MSNLQFQKRVKKAVAILVDREQLLKTAGNSLYSPVLYEGSWRWMAFSEPDGILARPLEVAKGDPARPATFPSVWAGVLVQIEEATSHELLNPWGKACLSHIAGGVWIDAHIEGARHRNILTLCHIVLITPVPTSTRRTVQSEYRNRKAILQRVDAAASDATVLFANQGWSAKKLAEEIWKIAVDRMPA